MASSYLPYVHQFPNNSINNIKGWDTKLLYCFYGIPPIADSGSPVDYIAYLNSLDSTNLGINLFDAIDDYERTSGILISKGIPQCLNSNLTNPSLNKLNAGIPFWYFKTGKTFRIRARLYVRVTDGALEFDINGGVTYKLRADQPLYTGFTRFQNLAWPNGSSSHGHTFMNTDITYPATIPVDLELVYHSIMVQDKTGGSDTNKVTYPSFKCNGYYQYSHNGFSTSDNKINSYVPIYGLMGGDEHRSTVGKTEFVIDPDTPSQAYPLNLGDRSELPSNSRYFYNDKLSFYINFSGSETNFDRLTHIYLDYLTIEELS